MKRAILLTALVAFGCGESDPAFVGQVPTNPDALLPWLQSGQYSNWEREQAVHDTAGPHRTKVRTYFNISLAGSFQSENTTHVVESAAVKELYEGGLVVGWAAMVKTEPGEEASSWYFFELLDENEAPLRPIEGQGLDLCAQCHASGRDYIMTNWGG